MWAQKKQRRINLLIRLPEKQNTSECQRTWRRCEWKKYDQKPSEVWLHPILLTYNSVEVCKSSKSSTVKNWLTGKQTTTTKKKLTTRFEDLSQNKSWNSFVQWLMNVKERNRSWWMKNMTIYLLFSKSMGRRRNITF